MTTPPEWAILRARELLAADYEARGLSEHTKYILACAGEEDTPIIVLARTLAEQPTFEQRVEALMKTATWGPASTASDILHAYDARLAEIMAPPVDPLVEVLTGLGWCNADQLAPDLRKALAGRNLEIVERSND